MSNLQQRTPAWHAARKGKLTASNLGGLLGLCSWCSRQETYNRIMGVSVFQGNEATQWGNDNEQNAINDYMADSGYVVDPSGLHIHPAHMWIAGSPDGLVGETGMIEVKCPFYKKVCHNYIPLHYYIQMQALLVIIGREWCDFISWTPDAYKVYRITVDKNLFEFCLPYWGQVYSQMQNGVEKLPQFKKGVKEAIAETVRTSLHEHSSEAINNIWWGSPPCLSTDEDEHTNTPDPKRLKSEEVADEPGDFQ